MSDDPMDDLIKWADAVLDEHARRSEHLTEEEMFNLRVTEEAERYTLADGWEISHPDDPRMRRYLLDDEGMHPDFADAVLAKMRDLTRNRPPGWDEWKPGELEALTRGGELDPAE